MKTDQKTNRFNSLLPNYFIKIGILVVILSILFFISGMIFEKSIPVKKEIIASIGLDGIIIGLLLISLSKSKIEDELIVMIRMQAFAQAFIFSVIYVVAISITTLVMKDDLPFNAYSLIIVQLIMFIIFFYLGKKDR